MNALELIHAATEPTGGNLKKAFTSLREALIKRPVIVTVNSLRVSVEASGDEHLSLGPAIQITQHGRKDSYVFCAKGKIVVWDFQDDEIHHLDVPESTNPNVLLQYVLKFVAGPKQAHSAAESETQADKTLKVVNALEMIAPNTGKLHKIAPHLFVCAGSISFASSYMAKHLSAIRATLAFELSSVPDTSSVRTRCSFDVHAEISWSMVSGELHLRQLVAEHECEAPFQNYNVSVTGLPPAGVVNKITALASQYVIANARHILNGLVPEDARFEAARQHYANSAEAAAEPQPANDAAQVVTLFWALMKKLPMTDPDKRIREFKSIHFNGLDFVVLAHDADATIRVHILDGLHDTCGFVESETSWRGGQPFVHAELQGPMHAAAKYKITSARDSKDLLRQLLLWFTAQYKIHQAQLRNVHARNRK